MTGGPTDRPRRPHHSHLTQSHRSPVPGCPACALIRLDVMRYPPHVVEALSAAHQLPPVPQPPEASP
ncbi:hypothetical protein [Microbacterium testaceum]|nr:hypothetical protein [Microbacterium testaceum]